MLVFNETMLNGYVKAVEELTWSECQRMADSFAPKMAGGLQNRPVWFSVLEVGNENQYYPLLSSFPEGLLAIHLIALAVINNFPLTTISTDVNK